MSYMLNQFNSWQEASAAPMPLNPVENFPQNHQGLVSKKLGSIRKKAKRVRTAFTTEQVMALEKVFQQQNYVKRGKRQELIAQLDLSDRNIRVWFQNRRMKKKLDDESQKDASSPPLETPSQPSPNNVLKTHITPDHPALESNKQFPAPLTQNQQMDYSTYNIVPKQVQPGGQRISFQDPSCFSNQNDHSYITGQVQSIHNQDSYNLLGAFQQNYGYLENGASNNVSNMTDHNKLESSSADGNLPPWWAEAVRVFEN